MPGLPTLSAQCKTSLRTSGTIANSSLRPAEQVDEDVRNSVNWNIDQLSADYQCVNPYQAKQSTKVTLEMPDPASLSICAADIAHLLEKLRPQAIHTSSPFDPFLSSSQTAFKLQYSRTTTKFDRLCRRILESIEPGQSSKNVHPCQENWASILISQDGDLSAAATSFSTNEAKTIEGLGDLDPVQDAALRLADRPVPLQNPGKTRQSSVGSQSTHSLSEMFAQERMTSHIKTDSIASVYWHKALKHLQLDYPLTVLTGDDTKVLGPLSQKLAIRQIQRTKEFRQLEQEVAELEASYALAKANLNTASGWLDKLRIKLWYAMDVISSNAYDNARNITVALNNMAVPALQSVIPAQEQDMSLEPSRPGTSATSASSVFDQPRIDTETILKAPAEHGGPRKLSDTQIEKTKKWLERNHVENFCSGEERIHRFCMEVKSVTKKLVGETLKESPVLWASDLFTREKSLYDIHLGTAFFSGPPSTRTPSVMSEPLSSTSFPIRAAFAGSRGSIFSGSSRLGRDTLGSDISSYISSPGRATTSTTLESSIWSSAQSNARSVTSVSSQSRAASTFEVSSLGRSTDRSQEKASFLENLRQDLTSLLLSDLACPVWSCGSESDAWMDTTCRNPTIVERFRQRTSLAHLLHQTDPAVSATISVPKRLKRHKQRSQSVAPNRPLSTMHPIPNLELLEEVLTNPSGQFNADDFLYLSAFNDVLCRVRDHTDPMLKLNAIRDFKTLSQAFQQSQQKTASKSAATQMYGQAGSDESTRRRSLDPSVLSTTLRRQRRQKKPQGPATSDVVDDEAAVVRSLRDLLFFLRPRTIFRDLQYIAVFVSSDSLDDVELGQAFLHMGLAALAWKDEVCRSMVDVADRIVAKDSIKRSASTGKKSEPSVLKAMEYWIIGAREGNSIAQRELASLYLTHSDVPPIVSLPLALSSEIFKSEMAWEAEGEFRRNTQTVCLALHWMQEAAKNGDVVAQTKLKEREAGRSIR